MKERYKACEDCNHCEIGEGLMSPLICTNSTYRVEYPDTDPLYARVLNPDGMCKQYERTWWKFWAVKTPKRD